jgi:peptide/nickel transport system permease protein
MVQQQAEIPQQAELTAAGFRPKRGPKQHLIRFIRTKPLATFGAVIALLVIFVAVFADQVATHDPGRAETNKIYVKPAWFPGAVTNVTRADPNPRPLSFRESVLGGDRLGRDEFSRLVHGARISLKVGLLASFVGVTIGLVIGVASAYFGGKFDLAVQRIVDTMIAFPGLLLAIVLLAALGQSVNNVVYALTIAFIPPSVRLIRSQALAIKEMDYVLAARAVGTGNIRIMTHHIIPNVFAIYLVVMTFYLGAAIIAEAGLSFLGLGASVNEATWGGMLSDSGQGGAIRAAWWLAIFPGVTIVVVVLAWNMLGDGLRDVLDPRLRRG